MAGGSTYVISGADLAGDELRSLRRWMLDVRNVGGPVDLRQADPKPGELGSLSDALVVAAGSGGALTTLAGAVVSWVRHRTTDLTVTIVRPDGAVLEVDGKRVRAVDAQELTAMISNLAAGLAETRAADRETDAPAEVETRD
jgi:hypothetical protein